MLISPAYVELLNNGMTFIPDLLRQIYLNLKADQAIDVVVAVVDGISFPAHYGNNESEIEAQKTSTGYTGNGISCIYLETEHAAPDLWSEGSKGDDEHTSTTQQQSTLSFQFETPTARSYLSKVITLPVANTIFHNGRESTIQAQRWIVGEQIQKQYSFACAKRIWLKELLVRVDSSFTAKSLGKTFQLSIPLQPITSPRIVATSMGNVVRQIYTDGSSGSAVPASKELEGAVVEWIADQGLEMQTVEVWALVTAQTVQSAEARSTVGTMIDRGSHLHKVLSGGGGWGSKQGLLALDPESGFKVNQEFSPSEDLWQEDPEVEKRRNLGQIINPGDTVQFFVRLPRPASPESSRMPASRRSSWVFDKRTSFVFGTTSSTIDSMPMPNKTEIDDVTTTPCVFSQRHFGMLSERGMSLTTVGADGQTRQTKIDVPHASISSGVSDHPPLMQQLEVRMKELPPGKKSPDRGLRIRKMKSANIIRQSHGYKGNRKAPTPGLVSDTETRGDPMVISQRLPHLHRR
ncbi:MAG: hypothetical protein Q9222_005325 [Ikaeria aurantiellina]